MKAYYETLLARQRENGRPAATAADLVAVAFLEIPIAQRDDRRLLNDPDGLLQHRRDGDGPPTDTRDWTLYVDGFSAARFIEVIERDLVWAIPT